MRTTVGLVGIGLWVSVSGCAYNWRLHVREAAALHHQCPLERIEVVQDNEDRYARIVEMRVCNARRVYQDLGGARGYAWVDVTNSTMGEGAGGESQAGSTAVRRTTQRTADGDVATLRATVNVEDFELRFVAIPSRDANHLFFGVHPRGDTALGPDCTVGLMIDATLQPLTDLAVLDDDGRSAFRTVISLDTLRAMSTAARVSGRVCTSEWRLDAASQANLAELVARFEEDLSWISAQPSPGRGTAPAPAEVHSE